jgi:Inhibitor of growth proteins N-terminal histone-binding
LQRHFQGLRDLDLRVTALQKVIDADCLTQLQEAAERQQETMVSPSKRQKVTAAVAAKSTELAQRIEHNMNETIKLSEEKMNRAQQIYDYIDQHIRKLDKDLKSFEAEVAKERQRLGLPAVPGAEGDLGGPSGTDGRRKRGGKSGNAPPEPVHVPTSEELYQAALAVADATEPTYCYCNRISFGEMIACDNVECPIEWFHFECVGLTPENRPKGKMFFSDFLKRHCRKTSFCLKLYLLTSFFILFYLQESGIARNARSSLARSRQKSYYGL